jgi:tetratricopeptide (TPR) repeat protein
LVHRNLNALTPVRCKCIRILLGLGLSLSCAFADTRKLQVDRNTPEGQFLELVSLESDGTKKVALLEQFLVIFPTPRPALGAWVYNELQDRYRRAGQIDKALAAGEKLLSLLPDDIETARANWKLAETKGDEALVKRWSAATAAIADRLVKMPLPIDPDEVKAAEERIAYARQFVVNPDHSDYVKALAIKDPIQRIVALEELVQKSPQNPYLDQIEIAEFVAYQEANDLNKALAVAEKIIAHNDKYGSALIFVADINFRRQKDPKRTIALATKFIEQTPVSTKPDGMSDPDWALTKSQVGLAHFIIGSVHLQNGEWGLSDKALRSTLAFAGDDQFRASILNQLGWVNYRLQNAIEAIKFYRQCAAIKSPLQESATKAIASIKSEYSLP